MKLLSLMLGMSLLTGCAGIKQASDNRKAQSVFEHKVYITIENARINDEPANILGGKIKKFIEEFSDAVK